MMTVRQLISQLQSFSLDAQVTIVNRDGRMFDAFSLAQGRAEQAEPYGEFVKGEPEEGDVSIVGILTY